MALSMYKYVDIYADIAIWVLNNQITKDENDEKIQYDYKLIDDLDHSSNRTRFHSLLHHCHSFCCSQTSTPTQSFYSTNFDATSQLCRQDSLEYRSNQTPEEPDFENPKDRKPEYEPTNHMLYVMVSNYTYVTDNVCMYNQLLTV